MKWRSITEQILEQIKKTFTLKIYFDFFVIYFENHIAWSALKLYKEFKLDSRYIIYRGFSTEKNSIDLSIYSWFNDLFYSYNATVLTHMWGQFDSFVKLDIHHQIVRLVQLSAIQCAVNSELA